MGVALQRRPEEVRGDIAADPEKRQLLRDATSELLKAVEAFLTKYVVLPDEGSTTASALYVLHTWCLEACDATPYLVVVSAEKGSGKTRMLEALSYLVRNPWQTANTTPTALFRRMSEDQPTLLLDELDTIFKGGSSYEALRAVLNAGNRRGSTVTRCDGKWGTREYETFGAKVLAGIDTGFLPETILDRSIVIRMRKRSGEQVERLRPRIAAQEAAPLAYTLSQWALVVSDELAKLEPQLPAGVSDRAADSWEPLLAVADFAGGDWPERARAAAGELSGPAGGDAPAPGLLPAMADIMGPDPWLGMEAAAQLAYERKQESAAKRAEAESRQGFASRANCGVCGRFKSEPAEICGHCGDAPLQHNGDRHEFNRAYGASA